MAKITVLSLLFTLSLTGCGLFSSKYTDVSGLDLRPAEVAKYLVEEVNQNARSTQSIRAFGKLTVRRGPIKQRFSEVIVFERPDKLRLELFLSEFNKLTALVTSSSGRVVANDLSQSKLFYGMATHQNMTRLLHVPFTPEEVMLWTLGRFYIRPEAIVASRAYARTNGARKVLELGLDDGRKLLIGVSQSDGRVACANLCLDSIEVRSKQTDQTYFFSEYHYSDKSVKNFPDSISFVVPSLSLEGELALSEITLNPSFTFQEIEKLFPADPYSYDSATDLDQPERNGSSGWSLF